MDILKKLKLLFSPVLMGILLVVIGFFLALATFIENDFGTEYAKIVIYNSWWMEVLIILVAINITGRIFEKKLYRPKKFSIFLFHLAMVVMIIGAGLTRYFGEEGMMHIREGQSSSVIVTRNRMMTLVAEDNNTSPLTRQFVQDFKTDRSFKEEITTGSTNYDIRFVDYYSRAKASITDDENGQPVVGIMVSRGGTKAKEFFNLGDTKRIGQLTVTFGDDKVNADIKMVMDKDSLKLVPNNKISALNNAPLSQDEKGLTNVVVNQMYHCAGYQFAVTDFKSKAILAWHDDPLLSKEESEMPFLRFEISDGKEKKELIVNATAFGSNVGFVRLGEQLFSASYNYQTIQLPFSIHLKDFKIDRYPGSNSPSSFSSYVMLNEEGYEPVPFHIYMNNILKHHGYRFYQSSYDKDERGTILSVNDDSLGTTVTYIGYFILFFGMIWSMFNKNSYLRKAYPGKRKAVASVVALMLLFSSGGVFAQSSAKEIDASHAEKFGQLLVQNPQGRTEPMSTMSSALLRKIHRSETFEGQSATQVFLDMNINYDHWKDVNFIKVSNKALQKELGLTGAYGAYSDFIQGNAYKLQKVVEQVYSKAPNQRGKYDKEVMKVDERINICYSIFTGQFFNVLPAPGSRSGKWYHTGNFPKDIVSIGEAEGGLALVSSYFTSVNSAKETGNYSEADRLLAELREYQMSNAGYELPSPTKIKVETMYNNWNVFKRLFPFYATVGFVYLIILIIGILRAKKTPLWLERVFVYGILPAFIVHTLAIAARWYISGHAPMSNGYESMIFISWVTILAGYIFNKHTQFALPSTAILAAMTLMVSDLSFMDPEITNLVPVLKSYWLTLHVSVIISSYAFLGLGFVLAIVNLILFVSISPSNKDNIKKTIGVLTFLNQKSIIVGVHLLTIGTFLGAIWANESWGRYWGWDAKETWSLITIIVYTFVSHVRLIKGLSSTFLYNILALYAFASVLMTYFGVNYYLSGLHSYASGDPVPIPNFVYVSVAVLILLTVMAGMNYRNNKFKSSIEQEVE
ncbi:cytochrome c biogenesis protein CcsA [Carboxylicivirga marina]|uniref:Cytochrome c biogenesis protein CcsA n=1 Tax=Carboxylicivirga marina TaxID=2800988 RepID=A0ABS1HE16_9BACT|nr:cytochrome c biogenesis protein CcsA [Carboxylicivirga marina]MBK3515879.1 cytochrome c biogenesis protein CcsA [Carboxylicivirga marina]